MCVYLMCCRFINARRRIVQPMIDQSNRTGRILMFTRLKLFNRCPYLVKKINIYIVTEKVYKATTSGPLAYFMLVLGRWFISQYSFKTVTNFYRKVDFLALQSLAISLFSLQMLFYISLIFWQIMTFVHPTLYPIVYGHSQVWHMAIWFPPLWSGGFQTSS